MTNNFLTRDIKSEDLTSLEPILQVWIRDSETQEVISPEIRKLMNEVTASIAFKNDLHFIVAESEGTVAGMMGLKPITEGPLKVFAKTEKPVELINAYVDPKLRRGQGVGTTLLNGLEDKARKMGFKEILLNSGPRYKDTAWGFYTKMYGEPVGLIPNMYGEGRHAPVWRKKL